MHAFVCPPPPSAYSTATFLTYPRRSPRGEREGSGQLAAAPTGDGVASVAAVAAGEGSAGTEGFVEVPPLPAAAAAAAAVAAKAAAADEAQSLPQSLCDPSAVPEEDRWAVGGTAAQRFWSFPGTADLRVRGKKYLTDKKKIPAAMPMFDLHSAELIEVDEPLWHMARFLPSVK